SGGDPALVLELGIWSFSGVWSLVFGVFPAVWSFHGSLFPSRRFHALISPDETPRRHQRRRPDGITHWPAHTEDRRVSPTRSEDQHSPGFPRCHLHCPVELSHRPVAGGAWHRRQRLVQQGTG